MKLKSYLLLFFLALILFFILGVRYGQKVEKANKIINYVLSITPRITPKTPISFTPNEAAGEVGPTPPIYATSESKIWKIQYTYPSFLKVKEDPTKSAVLFEPF